ncbi:Uncharacterized protein LW94_7723 [Fusarium fujikuroi]|nr:Uncharacterized protein LW93_8754 [Fusarium fujikuroi]KLP19538.1 Uncharacterized protein LW94_7723 [Fusarium fujikuroi]
MGLGPNVRAPPGAGSNVCMITQFPMSTDGHREHRAHSWVMPCHAMPSPMNRDSSAKPTANISDAAKDQKTVLSQKGLSRCGRHIPWVSGSCARPLLVPPLELDSASQIRANRCDKSYSKTRQAPYAHETSLTRQYLRPSIIPNQVEQKLESLTSHNVKLILDCEARRMYSVDQLLSTEIVICSEDGSRSPWRTWCPCGSVAHVGVTQLRCYFRSLGFAFS